MFHIGLIHNFNHAMFLLVPTFYLTVGLLYGFYKLSEIVLNRLDDVHGWTRMFDEDEIIEEVKVNKNYFFGEF